MTVSAEDITETGSGIWQLRRDVQAFVDALDYEVVRDAIENDRAAPVFQTELHGLHILVEPIPKHLRGRGGRAVGVRILPGGVVRSDEAIASSIRGKASRYGDLDLPYIIAVNALETYANADTAIDALFGTEAVEIARSGLHSWVRTPNGVWQGPAGPIHTRVSAVLSTERLSGWDLGQRSPRLIYNPWAARPLPEIPLGLTVKRVINEVLQTTDGASLGALFGLPDGWPE